MNQQEGIVINVLNKEKADELIKLGFHCHEQKINDEQMVYQFLSSPELMNILASQFEELDFFMSKNLCFS